RRVSSGTEATMSAIRLARGATGRDVLLKFDGCYHGHADSLLVKAGSGGATFGIPDSAGGPESPARLTVTTAFNDIAAVRAIFEARGREVAAVIVEPVAGNMGVVPPAPGFLEALRELCTRHGAVLIFDEVITGFRLAFGGAQMKYGVSPDLTCLGKIIGGGLPVGAYGGRRDLMSRIAPLGPVYQAGTLSGNPLAVAAGLATLRALREGEVYRRLDTLGAELERGLLAAAGKAGGRRGSGPVDGDRSLNVDFRSSLVIRCTRFVQTLGGHSTVDERKGGCGSAGCRVPRRSDLPGSVVVEPSTRRRNTIHTADQLPAQHPRPAVQDRLPVLSR